MSCTCALTACVPEPAPLIRISALIHFYPVLLCNNRVRAELRILKRKQERGLFQYFQNREIHRGCQMSQRAKQLSERLRAFTDEVIAFAAGCSEKNWKKVCAAEQWPVGVTARHIGAGHFEAVNLARMIVNGQKLPEITMDQLVGMANEHARQHAECTREEVLGVLRRNGAALVDYAGRAVRCRVGPHRVCGPGRRRDDGPAVP